ncbi:MAG: hypothetical protein IJW63_02990 [Lachnospiraceae bacterium]|nr:hypothetical protein [Lachnospiraceae bacterium]
MAIDTEKDIGQFKNRLRDLADKSYKQNIYTFTTFLGLPEQDIFWQMERELKHVGYELCDDMRDRKVIRFGNPAELGYEEEFPIVCIHITPLLAKFVDRLSHRDFLGSLMNLGIDRSTLGDIVVGEKEGYLYCLDSIADFICENLTKIKHTNVRCQVVEDMAEIPQEEPTEQKVLVSSERLDGVIAKVYQMSRGDALEHFRAKRVFVDGRLCENNSKTLKPGEVVNVRGYGKFIYEGVAYETKKGKLNVTVKVFG